MCTFRKRGALVPGGEPGRTSGLQILAMPETLELQEVLEMLNLWEVSEVLAVLGRFQRHWKVLEVLKKYWKVLEITGGTEKYWRYWKVLKRIGGIEEYWG